MTSKPLNPNINCDSIPLMPKFSDAVATAVTAATVECAITDGVVTGTTITAAGAGYSFAPTLTASSGDATFTATIDPVTGAITAVEITKGGTGYSAAPTIAVSGGYNTFPIAQNTTAKLVVPQSAAYLHLKNRTGSSGAVTITVIKGTTAHAGSYVLAAGEEIDLPCAGMGYVNKTASGNASGEFPEFINVATAGSTICDGAFYCMSFDGQ